MAMPCPALNDMYSAAGAPVHSMCIWSCGTWSTCTPSLGSASISLYLLFFLLPDLVLFTTSLNGDTLLISTTQHKLPSLPHRSDPAAPSPPTASAILRAKLPSSARPKSLRGIVRSPSGDAPNGGRLPLSTFHSLGIDSLASGHSPTSSVSPIPTAAIRLNRAAGSCARPKEQWTDMAPLFPACFDLLHLACLSASSSSSKQSLSSATSRASSSLYASTCEALNCRASRLPPPFSASGVAKDGSRRRSKALGAEQKQA